MRFKVGDRVKVIANTYYHHFPIGEVVEIASVSEENYRAKYLDGHDFWYVLESEIELITEPTPTEHIAIFRRKNRIVATITKGEYKFTQSVSLAKCKGDFKTAVKIVVEKLMGKFEVDGVVEEVEEVAKDTDLTAKGFKVVKQDKYEVGDKVKVREDLSKIDYLPDLCILTEMQNQSGCVIEISKEWTSTEAHSTRYKAGKDKWYSWSDECFEGKVIETTYREVSRHAEVGEWIKVTDVSGYQYGKYILGDIMTVDQDYGVSGVAQCIHKGSTCRLLDDEYVVLENYTPEAKPEPFRKAKVGDKIKVVKVAGYHIPMVNNGDHFIVRSTDETSVDDGKNVFWDLNKEYEIIEEASIVTINPLSPFTNEQLFKELFNRQGL